MAAALQSTSEGCTLILTITNPDFKNALGPEIYAAGIEALNAAETNSDIRSVVITGADGTFCAGGNLQKLLANRRELPEVQVQSIEGLHNWIDCIRTYPKPVIAAVEGAAAGAGFSLVLACDLCVAAEDAIFVMAYSSVALSPDGGGSWALARALPRALAGEIMMLGERMGAERLFALGLINKVVPSGTALAQAKEIAERLNSRAPNALASIKELINGAATDTLSQHLANERDHFVRNLHHGNAGEGIASFLHKLKPHYR